ncbi:MAG: helix-turn-helix domain-containing protein [Lachnospiraceae bacterium]|nr:helix-turn-helix domain-containing protein [Lachnospiraceae bacterium]
MFPVIDLKETGINLRRIMDKRGISARDVQEYLNLASVQSVYNWCRGVNMPTIDNLYALSQLFQLPIDAIVCGNRQAIIPEPIIMDARERRLLMYYRKIRELVVA